MKKAVIFCYSTHHKNTRKIAEAVCNGCGAQLVMLPCKEPPDVRAYELIGFASGVYLSAFGRPVTELAERLEGLAGKDCFLLYTSGSNPEKYGRAFTRKLEGRGARVVGKFGCYGYDTYGPFKLVGGVRKGHPNGAEIEAAVGFCRELMERK